MWIASEGLSYAASLVEAATGAHVISPHVGLGTVSSYTGAFTKAGLVGRDVLEVLAEGAMLINCDCGEIVDATALGGAAEW